ncbi:unnamed protein product [Adineta steineri]|uniref:Peptidase C45 hydrolase domain-containing protein n=2 Tax=Adineta steineri TaxID=433720 RepID=A0A815BWI9_9BILA|nr:unnamed protein product [Adineta steineri]
MLVKHLSEPWFSLIYCGKKTVEVRLDKGHFCSLKPSDTIEFFNDDLGFNIRRKFCVKVISVERFDTFELALEKHLSRALPTVKTVEFGLVLSTNLLHKMTIDPNEIFPFIQFNGQTPRERGYEHGTILSERIDKSINIYREQFLKNKNYNEKYILNLCEQYRRGISSYSNDYLEELDSIAISSRQDPLWIIALNCRLEILNHLSFGIQNECTVLYNKETCQLAENWDWIKDFQHLAFINYIKSNGILQMIEPGVLAKVGFNSYGIGVTLNFVDPVTISKNPSNIPLHISLRAVLDQAKTYEQALDIFKQNGPGFGGHVLVGDDKGQCCCVEFPGDEVHFIPDHPYHTNHFLYTNNNNEHFKNTSRYQNSLDRYERVKQLWKNKTTLQSILFDYDDTQTYPICRSFEPNDIGLVGTVCSLIMNLKERTMNITKGNPRQNQKLYEFQLDEKDMNQ